jgi:methyltransferase (TIGR00027 family)
MTLDNTSNPIRNVSDTALWVAVYRAMESERPDALFHDPYARQLAGERGEAIVKDMPQGKQMSWAMVIRTAVMDEMILRCIDQGAVTVLNLAAGLDTRAYRLNLPAHIRWFHVDFAPMIEFVKTRLVNETPRCKLEYIAADLREPDQRDALFQQASLHGPVLVITEGLLVYLKPTQVAALAQSLQQIAKAKWWISDLASPLLLKRFAKSWSKKLAQGNAPFLFAPREGTAFFKPLGWHEIEFRSTWVESQRLKRPMRFAWFWNFIMKLQPKERREAGERMSGIFLLETK